MDYPRVDTRRGRLLVPYPEQVRILPQREMNSYHPISSRLEGETWAPGKFILSFNGVKSLSGQVVIETLVANYYEVFCKLNGLHSECVEETVSFFKQDRPQVLEGQTNRYSESAIVATHMFAPWLCK